jgi:hypothetical protein
VQLGAVALSVLPIAVVSFVHAGRLSQTQLTRRRRRTHRPQSGLTWAMWWGLFFTIELTIVMGVIALGLLGVVLALM